MESFLTSYLKGLVEIANDSDKHPRFHTSRDDSIKSSRCTKRFSAHEYSVDRHQCMLQGQAPAIDRN